jgi:hypothetical protein
MSAATFTQIDQLSAKAQSAIARERGGQRLVTVFILTGLVFMLLPGTFLGHFISCRRIVEESGTDGKIPISVSADSSLGMILGRGLVPQRSS